MASNRNNNQISVFKGNKKVKCLKEFIFESKPKDIGVYVFQLVYMVLLLPLPFFRGDFFAVDWDLEGASVALLFPSFPLGVEVLVGLVV